MNDGPMTTGQYLQVRRIKAHRPGSTVQYIAAHTGATERQVKAALDRIPQPRYLKKDRPKSKAKRKSIDLDHGPNPHTIAGIGEVPSIKVPPNVMTERDRRLAQSPRSLTAALMGDPPSPDWYRRA